MQKQVKPYGVIEIVGGDRNYLLLSPHPVTARDSWEKDNYSRWVVTATAADVKGKIFPAAFHIVTNAPFVVRYMSHLPEITINVGENE